MRDHISRAEIGSGHPIKPPGRAFSINSAAFLGVVLIYCIWVFSLPLFPTQDGAVHLYYTKVLSHLMSGSPVFSQFFAIRYPIPPYAVHYFLLLLLGHFFDLLIAEKIVVCLIIAGFAYGFRFFARMTGPGGDLVSFWAIPLALNWMLGMGFHNYCLSISVALWAMGAWLVAVERRKPLYWISFLLLIVLILFTHPVPLFLVLAFVAAEIVVRAWQRYAHGRETGKSLADSLSVFRMDALMALLAWGSLAYIALFVSTQRSVENLHAAYPRREMLHEFVRLKPLSLVSNTSGSQLYRLALYASLAAAVLIALSGIRGRWRNLELGISDLLLASAVCLGLGIPLLPRSMNGSDFFSDRLLVFVWIAAFAAAAVNMRWRTPMRTLAWAGGCVFSLGALLLAEHSVRPVAEKIALIETAPTEVQGRDLRGKRGMMVDSPALPEATNLTFDPFNWVAARYFRRADAIMLNSPWLDLPILPVRPRGELFANLFTPYLNNYPQRFRSMLLESQTERNRIGGLIDFTTPIGFPSTGSMGVDPLMKEKWPKTWDCERTDWFSVCVSSPERGLPFKSRLEP